MKIFLIWTIGISMWSFGCKSTDTDINEQQTEPSSEDMDSTPLSTDSFGRETDEDSSSRSESDDWTDIKVETDSRTDDEPGDTEDAGLSTEDIEDFGFDPSLLVGKTFLVSFDSNYWSTPPTLGTDIGAFAPPFIFRIEAADKTGFTALLGTGNESGEQDPCTKTVVVNASLDADAHFEFDSIDFEINLVGQSESVQATLYDFSLSGTFTDDAASFKKGKITTTMDARETAPLFYLLNEDDRNADNLCEIANVDFDTPCEACASDNTSYCMTLVAEYFSVSAGDIDLQQSSGC